MAAAGELRCVDAAIESVLEDIDSAFILKEEHRTRSLHGFVPVTPEAEAPRCAKAASRCFSLRSAGVHADNISLNYYDGLVMGLAEWWRLTRVQEPAGGQGAARQPTGSHSAEVTWVYSFITES
ncbi:unnamed protein product [Pleuronectes platessa]|uniref:Uncharacterized protein n=1 Tax=Pleuronectes platessa TaxID=8262 RepID=A0A9N7UL93_PLEPL|nr:unnamed protein product [Pleuronectes platessa]